ncbi:MAG: hypothetical protein AAGA92_03485 [Planctomycetota bacterium]
MNGEIAITESLTIDGLANTPNGVIIDASGSDPDGDALNGARIFNVTDTAGNGAAANYLFRCLTLTGGESSHPIAA